MKKDILNLIRTVAPGVATAFGGPLAGVATKVVSSALFGSDDKPLSIIEEALTVAAPDTMLKLKQAEVEWKKLDIEEEKIHADDRANARAREIAVKDAVPGILAGIYTVGYFAMIFYLLYKGLPKQEGLTDVLLPLVGILSAAMLQIFNYYFGSSKGSSDKTRLLGGG